MTTKRGNTSNMNEHLITQCYHVKDLIGCLAMVATLKAEPMRIQRESIEKLIAMMKSSLLHSYQYPSLPVTSSNWLNSPIHLEVVIFSFSFSGQVHFWKLLHPSLHSASLTTNWLGFIYKT